MMSILGDYPWWDVENGALVGDYVGYHLYYDETPLRAFEALGSPRVLGKWLPPHVPLTHPIYLLVGRP